MSELEIVRGGSELSVHTPMDASRPLQFYIAEMGPKAKIARIDLPRLEVLRLRDWLNEWLARTPT